jgi:hypothetical protein
MTIRTPRIPSEFTLLQILQRVLRLREIECADASEYADLRAYAIERMRLIAFNARGEIAP